MLLWLVQIGYQRGGLYSYDRLDMGGFDWARDGCTPGWDAGRRAYVTVRSTSGLIYVARGR